MSGGWNFTGRQTIAAKDVDLSLSGGNDAPLTVRISRLALDGLPPDAQVMVEAYRTPQFERFLLGTVAALELPFEHHLQHFSDPSQPLFRIKVVGADHRLLGLCGKYIPRVAGDSSPTKSLIKVVRKDLGEIAWNVNTDQGPVLEINERFPNYENVIESADFRVLAAPRVMSDFFNWAIREGYEDPERPDLRRWWEFIRTRIDDGFDEMSLPNEHLAQEEYAKELAAQIATKQRLLSAFLSEDEGLE